MEMEVAAPNRFPVRALVLNTEAVPVLEVKIDGLAPFRLRVVAFVPVMVGLAIVSVPVAAPKLREVAAPPRFKVVAVVLKRLWVAEAPTRVPLFIVVVPPFELPMFTLVVDEAAPPVPRFNVLVVDAAVDPVPIL